VGSNPTPAAGLRDCGPSKSGRPAFLGTEHGMQQEERKPSRSLRLQSEPEA